MVADERGKPTRFAEEYFSSQDQTPKELASDGKNDAHERHRGTEGRFAEIAFVGLVIVVGTLFGVWMFLWTPR